MSSSFTEVKIYMNKVEPSNKWLLCTTPDSLYMLEHLLKWKDEGLQVPQSYTAQLRKIIATQVTHVEY